MRDIFTVIEERQATAARAPKRRRRVVRYQVNVEGRWSQRRLTRRRALRALRLAKRLGLDAYLSPIETSICVDR